MRTIIKAYNTYSFTKKDPVIDQLRTMVKDSKRSYAAITRDAGTSANLLANWFTGSTRRPQSATVEAIGRALGFERQWKPWAGDGAIRGYARRKNAAK